MSMKWFPIVFVVVAAMGCSVLGKLTAGLPTSPKKAKQNCDSLVAPLTEVEPAVQRWIDVSDAANEVNFKRNTRDRRAFAETFLKNDLIALEKFEPLCGKFVEKDLKAQSKDGASVNCTEKYFRFCKVARSRELILKNALEAIDQECSEQTKWPGSTIGHLEKAEFGYQATFGMDAMDKWVSLKDVLAATEGTKTVGKGKTKVKHPGKAATVVEEPEAAATVGVWDRISASDKGDVMGQALWSWLLGQGQEDLKTLVDETRTFCEAPYIALGKTPPPDMVKPLEDAAAAFAGVVERLSVNAVGPWGKSPKKAPAGVASEVTRELKAEWPDATKIDVFIDYEEALRKNDLGIPTGYQSEYDIRFHLGKAKWCMNGKASFFKSYTGGGTFEKSFSFRQFRNVGVGGCK